MVFSYTVQILVIAATIAAAAAAEETGGKGEIKNIMCIYILALIWCREGVCLTYNRNNEEQYQVWIRQFTKIYS